MDKELSATTNSLALHVKEKQLGVLITNAKEIKALVIKKLEDYTPEKYAGDAKEAAKDRAELNAASKQLNDARIALEKEWLMPFNTFKDDITETVNLIKAASEKLDLIVKEKENEEKEAKKAVIQQMWNEEGFSLVPLERVFNLRWLNKGTKITSIQTEIKDIIDGIKKDLAALENFGEDTAQLKELYLTNLNITITLQKGAELSENRKRLAEMQAAEELRKAEEEKRVVEDLRNVTSQIVEQVKSDNSESIQTKDSKKEDVCCGTEEHETEWIFHCLCNKESDLQTVRQIATEYGLQIVPTITLKGTTKQLQEFRARMQSSGITYEKKSFLTLEVKA